MVSMDLKRFYLGKRVMVTGHTGFKGAWLCTLLKQFGSEVTGFALNPPTDPSLYHLANVSDGMNSIIGDIGDFESLKSVFEQSKPEIVFHLAAQPLVRESYQDPRGTYETNVMGTVNVLECVRRSDSVRTLVNVTTDKVYENREWVWGYRENERLDGHDPYSNSKSCSELVTASYKRCFFGEGKAAVSTARAGNVIGGGDFAKDRIIPDCVRAAMKEEKIIVRNPFSTRPYQHVLEPLYAYMLIAAGQFEDTSLAGCYNVGPDDEGCSRTGELVDAFCRAWGAGATWADQRDGGPHEASFLKLDCSKMKSAFGWRPVWALDKAIEKTVEWTKCWASGENVRQCMERQIEEFVSLHD